MQKEKKRRSGSFSRKKFLRKIVLSAFPILIGSVLITVLITVYSYVMSESRAYKDFVYTGNEILHELTDRLDDHALMLRAGVAFFSLSHPVSRDEWKEYVAISRIERYLPGVQGMGFAAIVSPNNLEQHITQVRNEGFPDYQIFPSHPRDVYT